MVDEVTLNLIGESDDIHDGNHPQGVSFSPDGLCALTATVGDSKLRLYNTLTSTNPPNVEQDASQAASDGEINQCEQQQQSIVAQKWKTALVCRAGDAVRAYDWYPLMKSIDPASCCFVSASRDQPIHLFDACTGTVRASYRPYNALDEMESPNVVSFSPDGGRLWAAGFRTDRTIHVFDTARPGRDSLTVLRLGKTRRSSDGQKGLISSLVGSPDGRVFVVGTYSPGSIYVYDDRVGQQPTGTILNGLCVVGHGRSHSKRKRRFGATQPDKVTEATTGDGEDTLNWLSSAKIKWFLSRAQGGVTQMRFHHDYILYSASRRSSAILAWDLRMLSGNDEYQSNPVRGLASFATDNDTNQRLEFDLSNNGQTLFVGGRDKCVRIYNTPSSKLVGTIENLDDSCNGVSFCQLGQTGLLAIATGSRRFPDLDQDEDETTSTSSSRAQTPPGFLRLYRVSGLD